MNQNNKLNILHWPSSYPDPERGKKNNAIFVEEHIRSLQPYCNNRVLFISPDEPTNNSWHQRTDTTEHGLEITRLYFSKKLNVQFLNVYIRLILFNYFLELILFKNFKPQIIHIHFNQSFFFAKLFASVFQIPMVITEHWSAFLGWPNIGKLRYKKAAKAFKQAVHIFPVSSKIKVGIGISTGVNIINKSTVINNCVDTSIFSFNNLSITPDYNLIFVGRNAEEKDIPNLLNAFQLVLEKIPTVKLHIVGNGDFYNIDDLCKQLNIVNNIVRYGEANKEKISRLMQNANLLVISSFIENSPCVIGEAHCCGIPVVATDVGGVSELILAGGLVPPKNAQLLADKIIEVLNQPTDRGILSKQAIAKFGYDAIGKQIFNVYTKVCAE
jgi:glycosyltransferase involved in cell wall biosynthesis